jgi:hypothetical protein
VQKAKDFNGQTLGLEVSEAYGGLSRLQDVLEVTICNRIRVVIEKRKLNLVIIQLS